MSINISRYVKITSGVGAGASVARRQLIGRFFTQNPLVPTGSVLEFSDADSVGAYFGTTSAEYLRAVFYFGWISKLTRRAQKISFAPWTPSAVGSQVYGVPGTYSLSTFTAISSGSLGLTLGGYTGTVSGINFSTATSLAQVASILQAAIRGVTAGGVAWTGSTVAFDPVRGAFSLVSGSTGADVVAVQAGTPTDVAGPLGWLTGAILSNGSAAQTITQTLANSINLSNNFGSFNFIGSLLQAQIVEAAAWNLAQNNMFMFCVPVTASNAAALYTALASYGGTTLTLSPLSYEYPELDPMLIMAATDYTSRNGTQNYMFQQFAQTPSVTKDADADTYDNIRVNYYGQTQSAGQLINFYQRGYMCGLATSPADQNVYANEIWLKDAAASSIMTLLLALAKVPANNQGRGQLMTILQGVINQAVFNGTISVGKTLSNTQQLYITNATGDQDAWRLVQSQGYWFDVVMQQVTQQNGVPEWKAVYTLIYSKDDIVRKVEGTHTLI